MTGVSVIHLIDGHRAAVAPGVPGTSLRLQVVPAPEIPGTMSKAKGAPRKYQDGSFSCTGTGSGEDGDSLEVRSGRGWALSPPSRSGDMDLLTLADFASRSGLAVRR